METNPYVTLLLTDSTIRMNEAEQIPTTENQNEKEANLK